MYKTKTIICGNRKPTQRLSVEEGKEKFIRSLCVFPLPFCSNEVGGVSFFGFSQGGKDAEEKNFSRSKNICSSVGRILRNVRAVCTGVQQCHFVNCNHSSLLGLFLSRHM